MEVSPVSAGDPFGTPSWDALRQFPRDPAVHGPHEAAVWELAEAAVDALEQFYNDGHQAMRGQR